MSDKLNDYTNAVWAIYTEHATEDERTATADVLSAARGLVDRIYNNTTAGFMVEDPCAEVLELLDDLIYDLRGGDENGDDE